MNFCPECNNTLYHKEHTDHLILQCNTCNYNTKFNENVIDEKIYNNKTVYSNDTNEWTVYDITLPHTRFRKCPNENCQSHKEDKKQDTVLYTEKKTLQLLYICCLCRTEWKYS